MTSHKITASQIAPYKTIIRPNNAPTLIKTLFEVLFDVVYKILL